MDTTAPPRPPTLTVGVLPSLYGSILRILQTGAKTRDLAGTEAAGSSLEVSGPENFCPYHNPNSRVR